MAKTFLTGCTHFGHANIIRLANRPHENVSNMDDALIDNWNSNVSKKDTVYHLGDFSFRKKGGQPRDYLEKLNGKIFLLQGNHDPRNWGKHLIELNVNKVRVVLFHYPIEEWNGWWRDSVHFHCHTHSKTFKSAKNRGNVGVDSCAYKPIEINQAIEILKS